MQVSASRIRELRNLATEEIFLDFPVVLCSLTDVAGIAVVGDDFFWQFILLDPTKVTTEDGLQEAYLHEVAHLLCGTNKHDLCFSVVLNIIRRAAHFELSAADSDYRDCLAQGITLKAGKQLSAKLSVSACKCLADSFTCANIVKACIAYICWDDKIVANMNAADLHSYIENFDLELVE